MKKFFLIFAFISSVLFISGGTFMVYKPAGCIAFGFIILFELHRYVNDSA